MKRLLIFILAFAAPLFGQGTCANFVATSSAAVPSGVTHFYFIDYVGGSDGNSGASEAAAFQHIPCGANATSNAAAACTSASGTGWIFKGGVTVAFASWPANVPFGGTLANPTYIGPDPGWFTGGSWTRPIFSGGGASLNADAIGGSLLTDSTHHASHFVLDNIEFTGFFWSSSTNCSVQSGTCGYVSTFQALTASTDTAWEFKNLYAHNITHAPPAGSVQDQAPYGLFWMPRDPLSSFHDGVIDNSDGGNDCCGAVTTGNIYNSYFTALNNAIYNPSTATESETIFLAHDFTIGHVVNTFQNFGNPPHGNCVHLFGTNPSTFKELIYNAYINCDSTDAETFEMEEDAATMYAFNLVVTNEAQPNGFDTSAFTTLGGTYYYFNITEECGLEPTPQYPCFHLRNQPTVTVLNMFGIGTNNPGPSVFPAPPYPNGGYSGTYSAAPTVSKLCAGVTTTNFGGTLICAPIGSGNGTGNLNITQTYPFAPLDATAAATIGTASSTTVKSLCTTISGINAAAGTACLSDTTLGVSYNTSNHTVSSPARTPILRPTGSANWQIGAYEQGSTTQASPATCSPTSGVVPQTVTCVNPNSGTTVACYNFTGSPATSGDGVNCPGGSTKYTGPITVSVASTLYIIAGTSTLADSSINSYTYTTGSVGVSLQDGAQISNGAIIH